MRRVVGTPRLLQSIAHNQFSRSPPTSKQLSRKPPNGWRRWRLHFMVTCSQKAWKTSRPSCARSGGLKWRASAISQTKSPKPRSSRWTGIAANANGRTSTSTTCSSSKTSTRGGCNSGGKRSWRQGIPHSARSYPPRALLQSTPQQAPARASRRTLHWAIDSIGHLVSASASDRACCKTARHPPTGRRACCRAAC